MGIEGEDITVQEDRDDIFEIKNPEVGGRTVESWTGDRKGAEKRTSGAGSSEYQNR